MNYDQQITIILYTKVPKPGFVKTRVIHPKITSEFQFLLHIAMIKDTLISISKVSCDFTLQIHFHPKDREKEFQNLILTGLTEVEEQFLDSLEFVPQEGETQEERFANAFLHAFREKPENSALIIGSDTPQLQPSLIDEIAQILGKDSCNSVLGPSQNGGFYLLGINPPFRPELKMIFNNESTYGELGEALNILHSTNISILPEMTDVDTFENLKSVRSILNLYRATSSVKNNYYFPHYTFELIEGLGNFIWES